MSKEIIKYRGLKRWNKKKVRAIVPPCNIGDKVWWVADRCDENGDEYFGIYVGEVVSFSLQKEGLWVYCRYEGGLTYWHLVADYFGKTVFLNQKEAENALNERNNQK